MYNADINVINELPILSLNRATIEFNDTPSYEEWEKNKKEWGSPKFCYYGGDANCDRNIKCTSADPLTYVCIQAKEGSLGGYTMTGADITKRENKM